VGVNKLTYNKCRDNIYSYKHKYLKDLSDYPDTKSKARIFIGARIGFLKKQLNKEKRPRYQKVIRDLIDIYERAR
jgi:uncharacterized protein YbgA (DUF1722 family)